MDLAYYSENFLNIHCRGDCAGQLLSLGMYYPSQPLVEKQVHSKCADLQVMTILCFTHINHEA